jgi:hypothetical protein
MQAVYEAMNGAAYARVTLCYSIKFAASKRLGRFCNDNVDTPGGASEEGFYAASVGADVGAASSIVGGYLFGSPRIEWIKITATLRRGLDDAGEMRSLKAPRVLRRGRSANISIRYQRYKDGKTATKKLRIKVPRSAPRGRQTLEISEDVQLVAPPTSGDDGSGEEIELIIEDLFAEEEEVQQPHSVSQLVDGIRALAEKKGMPVVLRGRHDSVTELARVLKDGRPLLDGSVTREVIVR